jgi:hypothetical protein
MFVAAVAAVSGAAVAAVSGVAGVAVSGVAGVAVSGVAAHAGERAAFAKLTPAPGSLMRSIGPPRALIGVYRFGAGRPAARQAVRPLGTAISRSDRGLPAAIPIFGEPDPPGSPGLLWTTWRRFDPSSSPSANKSLVS